VTSELRGGGLIRLRLGRSSAPAWAIPVWATLCGAIASGGLSPTLTDGGRLLLTMLLVDAGWGPLWGALATTDWAAPLRRWRNWRLDTPIPPLPYVRPGSPGDRLARWLAQLWAWAKTVLAPVAGHGLGTTVAGLTLSLVLATALGPDLLMLTVGGLALMQLALVTDRGRGQVSPGWDGPLRLGLPWLAGHLAFAPPTLPSAALAAAFSLTAAGAGSAHRPQGRALWAAGQLTAAALFLPLHRPLVVPFLALTLVPQLLLPGRSDNPHRWTRVAWAWLGTGMLLASWAV